MKKHGYNDTNTDSKLRNKDKRIEIATFTKKACPKHCYYDAK
jgi:hypothetical protein